MIKEHEAFLTTMEANEDKINSVVQFANRLVEERHFDADKIQRKAENIEQRRNANKEKALQLMEKLQDQLQLHQFLQDCDELGEWVQEKKVTAEDDTYRDAKTIHSKWTRHQAFEAEIAANKERLFAVHHAAEELMKQKPEFVEIISPKMAELQDQFDNLQTTTKDKGERLFDANREVLLHQTCDDIDSWMNELEKQIENSDTGTDLASVNILMQKQQMIETQMAVKAKQVTELETQAEYLQKTVPDKIEEIKEKKKSVEQRFEQLKAPLLDRQRQLAKKKEAFQFRRDVEDEKLWIHEKLPLASSTDYGNSLFNVQMLQKKNQSLKTETDNHEPRILTVISNGQKLIDEGHEDSPEFKRLIDELSARWRDLKGELHIHITAGDCPYDAALSNKGFFNEGNKWFATQIPIYFVGKPCFFILNFIIRVQYIYLLTVIPYECHRRHRTTQKQPGPMGESSSVHVRRERGRGLDERAGALHDGRRSRQGKLKFGPYTICIRF